MATRNGLQRFLFLSHQFCIFFGKWENSVKAAISASSLSAENKALLISSIDAINAACAAVDLIRVTWE